MTRRWRVVQQRWLESESGAVEREGLAGRSAEWQGAWTQERASDYTIVVCGSRPEEVGKDRSMS